MGSDPGMLSCEGTSPGLLDVSQLSPELFWDVAQHEVDPIRHRKWLLERVLERGKWEDWLAVSRALGDEELKNWAPRLRISPKSQNFLQVWLRHHAQDRISQ